VCKGGGCEDSFAPCVSARPRASFASSAHVTRSKKAILAEWHLAPQQPTSCMSKFRRKWARDKLVGAKLLQQLRMLRNNSLIWETQQHYLRSRRGLGVCSLLQQEYGAFQLFLFHPWVLCAIMRVFRESTRTNNSAHCGHDFFFSQEFCSLCCSLPPKFWHARSGLLWSQGLVLCRRGSWWKRGCAWVRARVLWKGVAENGRFANECLLYLSFPAKSIKRGNHPTPFRLNKCD